MKKTIYSLFLLLSIACALDIDIDFIKKQIRENPKDINYRIVLVKYYLQNYDIKNSQKYIDEIKKIEPSNRKIKILDKKVSSLKKLQSRLGNIKLENSKKIELKLNKIYNEKKFKQFIDIYEKLTTLKIPLSEKLHLKAAASYASINELHKSRLLMKIKEFKQSAELLDLKIILALKEIDIDKARKLYSTLNKEFPFYKKKKILLTQIDEAALHEAKKIKKDISKKGSFKALNEYVYLQSTRKKPYLAIKAVKDFLKKNKNDRNAKLLLAKLYYWNDKPDKALFILNSLKKHDTQTDTLLANILYEKGKYEKALKYLSKITKTAKTEKEKYFLQKREAFSYAFSGQEDKAQKLFKKLLKKSPKDKEILNFLKEKKKQSLLKKAVEYHKKKDISNALHYYKAYFEQNSDPKVAKEIAQIYYFDQKEYKKAIKYFKIYLLSNPDDNLIAFQLATSLEKIKEYKKASEIFHKIIKNQDQKLYYLSSYHYAYSLLQMQNDKEWLEARKVLKKLSKDLQKNINKKTKELIVHVNSLLKLALGPVQKPTYYKDIVLTEGAGKLLNKADVFSYVDIANATKPTLKMLLHNWEMKKEDIKPRLGFSMDYVGDSSVNYFNYSAGIEDIAFIDGVRYSAKVSKFHFNFKEKSKTDGETFLITAKKGRMSVSAGVEKFEKFYVFTPKITWSPVYGSHSFYIDMYYRNGSFANYKNCMIENKTSVVHAGIYDQILFEDMSFMEFVISLNAYKDKNKNLYALLNYPLFSFTDTKFDIEHKVIFNENFEYNSKTDLCYDLSKTYESSYIKYQPKFNFKNGYLRLSLGSGYSFKNSESINSFALKAQYTISDLAALELNCERVQSSFTPDGMNYCTFIVSQTW